MTGRTATTPVATPSGERGIAELPPGDLVYTVHDRAIVAAPLRRVSRVPVSDHRVMHVVLDSG